MSWLLLAAAGCYDAPYGACDPERSAESQHADACVVAALPGGNGGPGGALALLVGGSPPPPPEAATASGGEPGAAGTHAVGPPADDGAPGAEGRVEMLADPSYAFDASQAAAGSRILVLGDHAWFDLGDDLLDTVIAVERLELGAGTTLALGGYGKLIAGELVVGHGARLLLRHDGTRSFIIGRGGALDASGLHGGSVTVEARSIVLEGLLDASGSDGDDGAPGGRGGTVVIRTETLTLGPAGAIRVDGGRGGLGAAERPCTGSL